MRAPVSALDPPAPPGPAGGPELEPGEVEASLGSHGESAAESIQPEERIGAGNDIHPGEGELGDEIPVDSVAKPVVEAHAVQVDG